MGVTAKNWGHDQEWASFRIANWPGRGHRHSAVHPLAGLGSGGKRCALLSRRRGAMAAAAVAQGVAEGVESAQKTAADASRMPKQSPEEADDLAEVMYAAVEGSPCPAVISQRKCDFSNLE